MRPDSPQNWFLIRGLVRESADWGDYPTRFARANPAARVICVDLPGNGRHHRTVAPLKLSEMLDAARRDFRAALASEGIPGAPCFVLAISLGAMVTVEWLRGYPEEL